MEKTQFITFYSYKGGVGRTLALGNMAWEAASNGKSVVVIDFDLEAPGLPSLVPFREPIKKHLKDKQKNGGLFEFIQYFQKHQVIPSLSDFYAAAPIRNNDFTGSGEIHIVPAGHENVAYRDKLQSFDWDKFYEEENGRELFYNFRNTIEFQFDKPDIVLIDSRTGLTDIGGICTLLLPDKVVIFTGLNDQNLNGCKTVIDTIEKHSGVREDSKYLAPIDIIIVASHVPETEEQDLRKERIQKALKVFRRNIDVTLPYVPALSLEEKILMQELRRDEEHPSLMVKKYMELYSRIVTQKTIINQTDNSEMVLIPAGAFLYGSRESDKFALDNEMPRKTIDLPAFYMDVYPVTNKQYADYLNKIQPDSEQLERLIKPEGGSLNERCRIKKEKGKYKVDKGYETHPVIYVTWHGASEYAKWAGKRLPTEQEWEKAARGHDGRMYPWGNRFNNTLCNAEESGLGRISKVDRFPEGSSPFGCFDMSGNVWEWTDSFYDDDKETYILRGGSWNFNHKFCRSAFRKRELPFNRNNDIGFRCAKNP